MSGLEFLSQNPLHYFINMSVFFMSSHVICMLLFNEKITLDKNGLKFILVLYFEEVDFIDFCIVYVI